MRRLKFLQLDIFTRHPGLVGSNNFGAYTLEASAQTDYFASRKKEGTIKYGYRTWGTHARVFFKHSRMGTARTK